MIDEEPEAGVRPKRKYDLEERTAKFGEQVVAFARTVPKDAVTLPLIGQLVRAGRVANYCEADDAGTRKEFRHRIAICRRESREAKRLAAMLVAADKGLKEAPAAGEAKELNLHLLRDLPQDAVAMMVIAFSSLFRHSGFGLRH